MNINEIYNYSKGLKKIFDKGTSSQFIFFVTNRCNSRCKTCFNWKKKDFEDELTLTEIKKISEGMGEIIWFFISGGEPFLRDDLSLICHTFYKNNHFKNLIIPTNGILVSKIVKETEKILKLCPNSKVTIQLSIDGIGEDHDNIRGIEGNFHKIVVLVEKLKALKKKYKNLAIVANVVFCSFNQNKIKEIYDYIYNNFKVDNIAVSLVRGDPREVRSKDIDILKYEEIHRHIRNTKRFNQYKTLISFLITKKEDFMVDCFIKTYNDQKMRIPCLAGIQTAVLFPNGDLFPCELLDTKIGNLRRSGYDFFKIWDSKEARRIRTKIKNMRCFCTQECVYTSNVFLNPKVWPKFLKYIITQRIK